MWKQSLTSCVHIWIDTHRHHKRSKCARSVCCSLVSWTRKRPRRQSGKVHFLAAHIECADAMAHEVCKSHSSHQVLLSRHKRTGRHDVEKWQYFGGKETAGSLTACSCNLGQLLPQYPCQVQPVATLNSRPFLMLAALSATSPPTRSGPISLIYFNIRSACRHTYRIRRAADTLQKCIAVP